MQWNDWVKKKEQKQNMKIQESSKKSPKNPKNGENGYKNSIFERRVTNSNIQNLEKIGK